MITQLTAYFPMENHPALAFHLEGHQLGILRVIKKDQLNFVSFQRRITNPALLQVVCHLHEPVTQYSHALQIFSSLLAHAFNDDDHNQALVNDLQLQINGLGQQTSLI